MSYHEGDLVSVQLPGMEPKVFTVTKVRPDEVTIERLGELKLYIDPNKHEVINIEETADRKDPNMAFKMRNKS